MCSNMSILFELMNLGRNLIEIIIEMPRQWQTYKIIIYEMMLSSRRKGIVIQRISCFTMKGQLWH